MSMRRHSRAAARRARSPLAWLPGAVALAMLAACDGDSVGDGTARTGGTAPAGATLPGSSEASATADGPGESTPPRGFDNPTAGQAAPPPATILNAGGNDCAPGHYIGLLEGEYFSQVWGNGSVAIPFATGEMNGQPGMEFWLERTERECTDAEFCANFEIKGGKLRGWAVPNADAAAAAMPGAFGARFEMELSGELDCRSGQFRGQLLNACYDVLGTLYRMEGSLDASYDTATDAFVMGHWDLTEMPLPNALIPPEANIGGSGMWNASLVDDGTSPIAEGDGLCDKASGFDTQL